MATKYISTRVAICGRSANCGGGHSAIEQASYISREKMYSEYDCKNYYPKYSEDLVHAEVMLCKNAPPEYADPSVLWNAVEKAEKGTKAQLARTYKVSLPNEWSYELATEVMRDYVNRNFVKEGMCAFFAIHDSETPKTGQRNLHCHIMLTMRGIDENGKWMPKQKKVYLKDENGERIPFIDPKTGQQKVDKQNRKQWKCTTLDTNDWSSKEKAKIWRKDMVDTINSVNEQIGATEHIWEHRSFKELGLDILPQIHLGPKASALERAGIRSIRGDINRRIQASNAIIEQARATYLEAQKALDAVKVLSQTVVEKVKNEILDVIQEVARRKQNRLVFPVRAITKYIRFVSNRETLQNRAYMEQFVQKNQFSTFDEMKIAKAEKVTEYENLKEQKEQLLTRIKYLKELLVAYEMYEPYKKANDERWKLTGFARKQYEKKHLVELTFYDTYRSELKKMIREEDHKIKPKAWSQELDILQNRLNDLQKPIGKTLWFLACIEILEYNKKDLSRMLGNEGHKKNQLEHRKRKGDDPI